MQKNGNTERSKRLRVRRRRTDLQGRTVRRIGRTGPLASYGNDGETGTYDLSRSAYTEEGKRKKIREIIEKHLGNTGLMYLGWINELNYNQTITVYNRIKGADTEDGKDIWKRTVLENCFYKLSQTKIDDGKTAKMAGTYIARIPESPNYLPYREFAKTKGAGNSFTLNPGDIVVKDVCMEEITGKMPNTASELLARQKPRHFRLPLSQIIHRT